MKNFFKIVVLFLAILFCAGILIGLFAMLRMDEEEPKQGSYIFDIDDHALMSLTKEDYLENGIVPVGVVGSDLTTYPENEVVAGIMLISYNESTKELIVVGNGLADFPLAESICFVRAQNFPLADVPKIARSKNIIKDFFALNYEYECLLYVKNNSEFYWVNFGAYIFYSSFVDMSDLSKIAMNPPSADLYFDVPGSLKPTDRIMKLLTSN